MLCLTENLAVFLDLRHQY